MQSDRTADLEAVSIEVVQILQDHHALTIRLTHVIEKLALMQREDRQMLNALDGLKGGTVSPNEAAATIWGTPERIIPLSELAKHGPSGKPKGGYTHGIRQETKTKIDTSAEMPARTDMAKEPEPEAKEIPQGDHARTNMPEPENAPSIQEMTHEEHKEFHGSTARMYDRILDCYAEHGGGNAAIAKACNSTPNSVATYLRTARLNNDPRAAKGDLKRHGEEAPVQAAEKPYSVAAYRRATQPNTVEPMVTRIGKDAIIRVFDDTKMVDGPDDEVPMRSEAWREILKAMAHQQEMSEATVLKMLGKSFPPNMVWDEIKRTNLALAKTGLVIHSVDGGPVYQLRKLI